MERKFGNGTAVVTTEEIMTALTRAKTLASDEEKVVRMRHGVAADELNAPLPRAAGGNAELEDELLVIEMQLMRAWRRRAIEMRATSASASPAKAKIVRALRKKR